MSAVKDAADALMAALATVEDVRSYRDPGAVVDPPGTVLGPPRLIWTTGCPEPDEGHWLVYLVVPVSDRAMEQLWELAPRVVAALDEVSAAAVQRADPGSYGAGADGLPCYEIEVHMGLGD